MDHHSITLPQDCPHQNNMSPDDIPPGFMTDRGIIRCCEETGMIDPFVAESVREVNGVKVASFGVSSAGYDFRLSHTLMIPKTKLHHAVDASAGMWPERVDRFDIKKPSEHLFDVIEVPEGEAFILPPLTFALGCTIETFLLPDDVIAQFIGKSTWARGALEILVTPAEPGFRGSLTLEFKNISTMEIVLYPGEGITQGLFYKLAERPLTTYGDRAGKYQDQPKNTPVLPRV